jgi:hypothetical protein
LTTNFRLSTLTNGYSGLGLHVLFTTFRNFRDYFKNFVFLQVGIIDAGHFKGAREIKNLGRSIENHLQKYTDLMTSHGYHAEAHYAMGTNVVSEVEKLALMIKEQYPNHIFFAGQLVFPHDTVLNRILHNYTAFAIQKRLYRQGIPVVVLPVRV